MDKQMLQEKPFYLTDEEADNVISLVDMLSLEEKCGQLFCVLGTAFDQQDLVSLVRDYSIGGVLFRPDKAETIISRFRELDSAARLPLLKAANLEEGGAGGISDGTYFGTEMGVAACGDTGTVSDFAENCATEALAEGINWTFSPVTDICYNYLNPIMNVRTFGSDLKTVSDCSYTYVTTLQGYGMAACAKHYPGDGVDYRDQHLHVSVNSLPAEEWYATYGAVYRRIIDAGLLSIMVGHIAQPNVAKDINPALTGKDLYMPASLSPELLEGALRERLGFNGLITTDATIMGGFTMSMERRKAIPYAIACGCDMLVFNTDFKEDYGYMVEGVKSCILPMERLNDAVSRILALKTKVCRGRSTVSVPDTEGKALRCADRCVTLVKCTADYLPITKYSSVRLIILGSDSFAGAGDHPRKISEAAKALLEAAGLKAELYNPADDDLHGTASLDRSRLTLYLANVTTASNKTTTRIDWYERHAIDMPRFINEEDSIFVSLNNPYHLQDVPHVRVYINAYSATEAVLAAVVDKLLGRSPFYGISPVDAFCGMEQTKY